MSTLKDVAKECGLSLPTVSQIFGARSSLFSEETRKKVFEATERLGYRRNVVATNLASGKTNNLYVIMSSQGKLASSVRPDSFLGFTEAAAAQRQQISFLSIPRDDFSSPAFRRIVEEHICDGVIFNIELPEVEMNRIEAQFERIHLPLVWLNAQRPQNAILPNESRAAEYIAKKVIQSGHKKILFIGSSRTTHFSALERPKELKKYFLNSGGEVFRCVNHWGAPENFLREIEAFFKNPDGINTIVFDSDHFLLRIAKLAEQCGKSLFEDFSYAIFDCPTDYSEVTVRIRSCAASPDLYSLGYKAVQTVLQRIAEGGKSIPSVYVEPKYLEGETIHAISEENKTMKMRRDYAKQVHID
jgi:DNA-binding LacI/PurR family transcriptional regulator